MGFLVKHWLRIVQLLLLAVTMQAQAQQQTTFAQLQQLPQLQTARVLEQLQRQDQEKIYPLGSVRRISGRLRFTDEVLLRGEQSWLTLELASTHDASEAFAAVRQQLQLQDAQLLYWCQGRDCGPSNLWANTVFGKAKLYGPDDGQNYGVLSLAEQRGLLFVYAVTRGNGRPMLHLELFVSEQQPDLWPSAETLLRQLRAGETLKPNLAETEQWQNMLLPVLRRAGAMQVEIGGTDAQQWYEYFLAQGIAKRNLLLAEPSTTELYLRAKP